MAFEVEMKARVNDPEEILKKLKSLYEYLGTLHKEDLYFYNPGEPEKRFRIRCESEGASVTVKKKEVVQGGEINHEVEFKVDSPEAFGEFAGMIGFSEDYTKVKDGYRFLDGDALAELCELKGLGWYLEIEIVVESKEMISSAQTRVKELFSVLGITGKDMEPRFYSELLKDVGAI